MTAKCCRSLALLASLALPVGFLAACSSEPEPPEGGIPQGDYTFLREKVSWMIQEQLDDGVVGFSVAVIDGADTVWEAGFGFADASQQISAEPETVYEAGSISKLFTGTAVMQLVESGQVDLDGAFSAYLPGFSILPPATGAAGWSADQITPRTILTHHSGIQGDFYDDLFGREIRPYQDWVVRLRETHASFPPNTVFSYSNNGVTVLGHMVEAVSGTNFVEYIDQKIFTPLGMDSSSFALEESGLTNVSEGHRGGEVQERIFINPVPAGSLRTNVRDLARFAKAMLAGGGGVISEETLGHMWTRQNANVPLDLDTKNGLAWFQNEAPGVGRLFGHDGGTLYFRSSLLLHPELDLAVVVMTNSTEGNANPIAFEAIKLAVATKRGGAVDPVDAELPPVATVPKPTAEDVAGYAGHYQTAIGHSYYEADGDRLVSSSAGTSIELRPDDVGGFGVYAKLLGFIPVRVPFLAQASLRFERVGEHDVIVAVVNGQRGFGGVRIEPSEIPESWHARLGHYRASGGLYEGCALEIDSGMLRVRLFAAGSGEDNALSIALEPVGDDRAKLLGYGRNTGGYLFAEGQGEASVIEYLGTKMEYVPAPGAS